ncbi:hypothetical protein [Brachybacterium hainanense]|uniref:DUF1461 domain-containing protein n=1 Tax=Brachybacterium hainanense TaxID=1541174 RepID=A0ABV6RFV5_9MICO
MSSLRDVLATVLLIAATVLGALWLPSIWVADNVVDQDGFLAITDPLSDDHEFQSSITDSAIEALLADDRIPEWLADRIEPLAKDQASRFAQTDAYAEIWRATMLDIHTGLLEPGPSEVVVDVAPAGAALLGWVEELIPLPGIEAPASLPITVATMPAVGALEKAAALAPWAGRLAVIALVLVAAALLVAAHRRAVLVGAGVGIIVAGAVALLLSWLIEPLIPDVLDRMDFVGPLLQVFEQQFSADLAPQGLILAGVGAAVVVAGILALALRPAAREGVSAGSDHLDTLAAGN